MDLYFKICEYFCYYINVWLPTRVIFKEKINKFFPKYNIKFINIVVIYLYITQPYIYIFF